MTYVRIVNYIFQLHKLNTKSFNGENMAKKLNIDRDLEYEISSYKEVIKYLNLKAGKKFRLIENNLILIRRLFANGFTKEDCFKVIDNRVGYWKEDVKMNQYLRPVTLFRPSKFEGYLNAMPYRPPERKKTPNEESFDVIKSWGDNQKKKECDEHREFSARDGGLQVFGREKP